MGIALVREVTQDFGVRATWTGGLGVVCQVGGYWGVLALVLGGGAPWEKLLLLVASASANISDAAAARREVRLQGHIGGERGGWREREGDTPTLQVLPPSLECGVGLVRGGEARRGEACPDKWLHFSRCEASQASDSLLLLQQFLQDCQGKRSPGKHRLRRRPPASPLTPSPFLSFRLFLPSSLLPPITLTDTAAELRRAVTSGLSLLLRAPPLVTPSTT